MTRDEWETTVTWVHTDEVVRIYTANPKHLNRLRKDARATEVRGGNDWGEFTIPASQFDPLKGFKRQQRELTPGEKQALALRLEHARNSQNATL